MQENLCSVCNRPYEQWVDGLNICIDCCVNIHDMVYDTVVSIDSQIKKKYGITEIGSKPVKLCNCPFVTDMIPFDYYTPEHEDGNKYYLVLTGLCRSCEGYKILKFEDVEFDFMIKDKPPHLGLHINGKKKNLQFYT